MLVPRYSIHQQTLLDKVNTLKVTHPDLWDDEDTIDCVLNETDLDRIAAVIVFDIKEAEAIAEGIDPLIEKLRARQKRHSQRAKVLRELLLNIMQEIGISHRKLAQGSIATVPGQPKVLITSESEIPERFVRTTTTRVIDKAGIRETLMHGGSVTGAELSNTPPVLKVRTQ